MNIPNTCNGSLLSRFSEVRNTASFANYVVTFSNPNSDPPVGSLSSTVDLLGGMSTIRSRAAANLYKSQYDFDLDVTHLLGSANDGHLGIAPCSFSAIQFDGSVDLVSLSTDGIAIPKVYNLRAYISSHHI